MSKPLVWISLISLVGCGPGAYNALPPPAELHVAAASNLSNVMELLQAGLLQQTKIRMLTSFGSTAQLTRQIESGAPFDLFLAADAEHPAVLAAEGLATVPQIYARGRLALWAPRRADIQTLNDLAHANVKFVAIPNPDLAPYGRAALEALTKEGLLEKVRPKFIFGQNVNAARTYADTGNADAALTAYSLVWSDRRAIPVPEALHSAIEQALCIVAKTSQLKTAKKAQAYILSKEARQIFSHNGYAN